MTVSHPLVYWRLLVIVSRPDPSFANYPEERICLLGSMMDVPMQRSMTSIIEGKLGLHIGSLEKAMKELGWRKSPMCASANEMNL